MRLDTPAPAQLTLPNARTHAFDVRRSVLFNEHGLLADEVMQPSESAWMDGRRSGRSDRRPGLGGGTLLRS